MICKCCMTCEDKHYEVEMSWSSLVTTLETNLFVIIVITRNKQNLFQHFILFYSLVKKELILSDDHIKPATQVMKISFLLCSLFHRALSIYCSMWTRPQGRKLIFYQAVEVYLAASVAAIFFWMAFHVSPHFLHLRRLGCLELFCGLLFACWWF